MSFSWKAVVEGIKAVASVIVPGAAQAEQGIQDAITAKSGTDREAAIIAAVEGGLSTVEEFDPALIANPDLFHQGVVEAHDAFDKIAQSLKKS